MRHASIRNTSMGQIVQDLGEVDAVRVYSKLHPGRYADFSLADNGALTITYSDGATVPVEHTDTANSVRTLA